MVLPKVEDGLRVGEAQIPEDGYAEVEVRASGLVKMEPDSIRDRLYELVVGCLGISREVRAGISMESRGISREGRPADKRCGMAIGSVLFMDDALDALANGEAAGAEGRSESRLRRVLTTTARTS